MPAQPAAPPAAPPGCVGSRGSLRRPGRQQGKGRGQSCSKTRAREAGKRPLILAPNSRQAAPKCAAALASPERAALSRGGGAGRAPGGCPPAAPRRPWAARRGQGTRRRPGPPVRAPPAGLPLAAGRDVPPRSRPYIRAILPRRGAGSGAAPRAMDLGYFPLAFPPGLCRGAPQPPYPGRGDGAFLALGTAASAAPPPPPACAGAAGYAAVPPAVPSPGYRPPRGAGPPGFSTSIFPGSGRPPPPEPGRPCPRPGAGGGGLRRLSPYPGAAPAPGSPAPAAAPAAPRTFEWMRAKRSPPGRSEWGGGARAGAAPITAPLCPRPAPTLFPPPPPPRSFPLSPLKRGVFRRCRRRGAVRGGTSRLPRTHQLQHPAAHGAGEGVSLQPVPVAGPPHRGGPLAAPPRRPGEGLVPEPPHEAEEAGAGAGGAGRPRRRAHGCPGRPRLRPRRPPRRGLPGTSGLGWKLRPAGHPRCPSRRDRGDAAPLFFLLQLIYSFIYEDSGKGAGPNRRCCCRRIISGRAESAGWRSGELTGTAAPPGESREPAPPAPPDPETVDTRGCVPPKLPTPSSFCI